MSSFGDSILILYIQLDNNEFLFIIIPNIRRYDCSLPGRVVLHHQHELPLDPLECGELLVRLLPAQEQQVIPALLGRRHAQVVGHRGQRVVGTCEFRK